MGTFNLGRQAKAKGQHYMSRTLLFLMSPFGLAILCAAAAGWIAINRGRLAGGPALPPDKEFQRVIREIAKENPQAAHTLQKIEEQNARLGVIAAARSAGQSGDRRSIIANMAGEFSEGRTPYRARLAEIAFADRAKRSDSELEDFMIAHASILETMELSGYGESTRKYMTYLEQAYATPSIWSLVWDDPFALSIWVETGDEETVRLYRKNREWMADALVMLDFDSMEEDKWNLGKAIRHLAAFDEAAKAVVQEANLGVLGLTIMLTHGGLVDACWRNYQVPPAETVAVIYLNADLLGTGEGDRAWIDTKAAWLAAIRNNHATVWFVAMETPFALRLFRDTPAYAGSLLEKYGYADISTLIYQNFADQATIEAAARALDIYGDLAFYVFQTYSDESYKTRLSNYLTDPKIGIRAIPFIVRFGDDAFTRIGKDADWVDRYFLPDGSPRVDKLEWIEHIPGGAAVNVARNWAQGHPCELDELGWAAFDVGSAALALLTAGTSSTVTQAAKVAGTANKATAALIKAERIARPITMAEAASRWAKRVESFKSAGKLVRLGIVGDVAADSVRLAGTTVWQGIKVVKWTGNTTFTGLRKTAQAWKHLQPGTRKLVYRGLLATAIIVRVVETTAPNADKIAEGVGRLAAQLAAAPLRLISTAVSAAVRELLGNMPNPMRLTVVWIAVFVLMLFALKNVYRGIIDQRKTRYA